jgi:acyl-CoA synthetase (AMP-forming)/AMP-acid ligase II
MLAQDFGVFDRLIAAHAQERGDHPVLVMNERRLSYAELDALVDRIAAALQRDGVQPTEAVAICATTSIEYGALYVGILRAGAAVVPLAPSSTAQSLAAMIADCGARLFFLDADVSQALDGVKAQITARRVALDGSSAGMPFERWLAAPGVEPAPVAVTPKMPFNIIYSSGTTGSPKGIVQSHEMRWAHIRRRAYGADAVTMVSTPLYSNTTLVSFLPTLSNGATAVLMAKFDVASFLAQAQTHRATHAMLVPVQYKRLMDHPDFDRFDLSSFRMKFATSAPFAAELKADVLKRWPGGLVEYYGLTEGGGTCMLVAHEHPDKLHTVGRPAPGHDIRLIGEDGKEVAQGEVGEVVGHSAAIMSGYHNLPGKTSEAEWRDATGKRFIRTGDVGRFDADGFLTLMDRKKDMIISGGFNIYPSDLEAVLIQHPAVLEAAVVGVPSERWGETPVAFVALKDGIAAAPEAIKAWVDERVGKTQRLAALQIVSSLPRSHIGKVLKRELRDRYKLPAGQ